MDEFIDVLDESGAKTGETAPKSEAHRLGLWHRCFHCWISGESPDVGPYLLVQRRAADKDTWPGRLDVSVAGHISAGESALEGGLRELEEEVGLSVVARRLIPLGERSVEHEITQGTDREFHDVFLLRDFTPPEELRLQKEEVDAVLPIPLATVAAMLDGENVLVTEYKNTAAKTPEMTKMTETTKISLADFVSGDDPSDGEDYIRRIVEAARRLSAGERVERIF